MIILGPDGKAADWSSDEVTESDALVLVWDSDNQKGLYLRVMKSSEAGTRDRYKPPFFPAA